MSPEMLAALRAVRKSTDKDGYAYGWYPQSLVGVSFGLIEVNESQKQGDFVAVKLTTAGRAQLDVADEDAAEPAPPVHATDGYVMAKVDVAAMTPVKKKKAAPKTSNYPFDSLGVGEGFFVPATAEVTNPERTLSPTVSAFNTKYSTVTGKREVVSKKGVARMVDEREYSRKFRVKRVKAGSVVGGFSAPADGALVVRIV